MKEKLTKEEKNAIKEMRIIEGDLNYPIEKLISPEYNPNEMNKKKLEDLEKSIREFGFILRVTVNKHNMHIVGGNHRVLIAKERFGYTHVPVDFIYEKDLAREKLLNMALNKVHGEENKEKVKNIFKELAPRDPIQLNPIEPIKTKKIDPVEVKPTKPIDLTSSGYSIKEIEKIMGIDKTGGVKEDGYDDSDIDGDTEHGDIYKLGEHYLICGDSTDTDTYKQLENLLGKPKMIFTDPPYGINYYGGRSTTVKEKNIRPVINDTLKDEELGKLLKNVLIDETDIYICCSSILMKPFLDYIDEKGFKIESIIVWDKINIGLGFKTYRRQSEFIIYIKYGEFKTGDITDTDIWRISRENTQKYTHPTQKPIRVPARAIRNSSQEEDIVFDLFGGSGSTLIACEQMKRKCGTIELDPKYCDTIINRWEQFTGKKAEKI